MDRYLVMREKTRKKFSISISRTSAQLPIHAMLMMILNDSYKNIRSNLNDS